MLPANAKVCKMGEMGRDTERNQEETSMWHCRECGKPCVEAGSYQIDCPNGCWPIALEAKQAERLGFAQQPRERLQVRNER